MLIKIEIEADNAAEHANKQIKIDINRQTFIVWNPASPVSVFSTMGHSLAVAHHP